MKKILALAVLIFMLLPGFGHAGQVVVVAKLMEQPYKKNNNPMYDPVYIFKYKVIKVVSGKVSSKEILVGHYSPFVARDQIKGAMKAKVKGNLKAIKKGQNHKLVLVDPIESVWKKEVEDDYTESDAVRYFATQADLAQ